MELYLESNAISSITKVNSIKSDTMNLDKFLRSKNVFETITELNSKHKLAQTTIRLDPVYSRLAKLRNAKDKFQLENTIKSKQKTRQPVNSIGKEIEELINMHNGSHTETSSISHFSYPDSLLNTYKNFVIFKRQAEFNKGIPILRLKQEEFVKNVNIFNLKKKTKSVNKPMSKSQLFETEIYAIKKNHYKTIDLERGRKEEVVKNVKNLKNPKNVKNVKIIKLLSKNFKIPNIKQTHVNIKSLNNLILPKIQSLYSPEKIFDYMRAKQMNKPGFKFK